MSIEMMRTTPPSNMAEQTPASSIMNFRKRIFAWHRTSTIFHDFRELKSLPSGNLLHSYWKWPCFMAKSTINDQKSPFSLAISHDRRVYPSLIIGGLAELPPSLQTGSGSPSAGAAAHRAGCRPPPPRPGQRSAAAFGRPRSRGAPTWAADAPVAT